MLIHFNGDNMNVENRNGIYFDRFDLPVDVIIDGDGQLYYWDGGDSCQRLGFIGLGTILGSYIEKVPTFSMYSLAHIYRQHIEKTPGFIIRHPMFPWCDGYGKFSVSRDQTRPIVFFLSIIGVNQLTDLYRAHQKRFFAYQNFSIRKQGDSESAELMKHLGYVKLFLNYWIRGDIPSPVHLAEWHKAMWGKRWFSWLLDIPLIFDVLFHINYARKSTDNVDDDNMISSLCWNLAQGPTWPVKFAAWIYKELRPDCNHADWKPSEHPILNAISWKHRRQRGYYDLWAPIIRKYILKSQY